jgi:hypothetical protein
LADGSPTSVSLEQLEQARARLAHSAFTPPPTGDRQAWLKQLDALRDRKENLENDLAGKSIAFQQVQDTRRLGAAEVAAALPPATVFVCILNYEHSNVYYKCKGPLRVERRLIAFVLRQGQAPVLIPLGASRPIDQAVETWLGALDILGQPEPESDAKPSAALEDVEKDHFLAVLAGTKWGIDGPRGAASILGLQPNTLRSRLKKLGVPRASHERSWFPRRIAARWPPPDSGGFPSVRHSRNLIRQSATDLRQPRSLRSRGGTAIAK